ncbi:MAG: virulence RhuM family protein [Planctomycetes bacterium]|nr:virulence RhuM family protein [Planctomycetota bacterium]
MPKKRKKITKSRRAKKIAESSTFGGEIVFYKDPDGRIDLNVRLMRDTIWLSQRQIATLFNKDSDTVGLHNRNVYKEGELDASSTTEDSSVVQVEGARAVTRSIRYYNLDVIISIGYRVNSKRGTQCRIWAARVLRDHLLAGLTRNMKSRMPNGLGASQVTMWAILK